MRREKLLTFSSNQPIPYQVDLFLLCRHTPVKKERIAKGRKWIESIIVKQDLSNIKDRIRSRSRQYSVEQDSIVYGPS